MVMSSLVLCGERERQSLYGEEGFCTYSSFEERESYVGKNEVNTKPFLFQLVYYTLCDSWGNAYRLYGKYHIKIPLIYSWSE